MAVYIIAIDVIVVLLTCCIHLCNILHVLLENHKYSIIIPDIHLADQDQNILVSCITLMSKILSIPIYMHNPHLLLIDTIQNNHHTKF